MVRGGTGDEVSGTNYDALDTVYVPSCLLVATHILFIYSRFRFIWWRGRSEDENPGDRLFVSKTRSGQVFLQYSVCLPLNASAGTGLSECVLMSVLSGVRGTD